VFKLSTDGSDFTTLHTFSGNEGAGPVGSLILSGDTLYGTTCGGGNAGKGTVFALGTDGSGYTNLHSFSATASYPQPPTNIDGACPYAGLVLFGDTLYGTTLNGGSSGKGTVFSLSLGSTPPTVSCSTPLILECTNGAAVGTIQAEVQDTNGNPIQVVWTIDGIPSQTNNISSEEPSPHPM